MFKSLVKFIAFSTVLFVLISTHQTGAQSTLPEGVTGQELSGRVQPRRVMTQTTPRSSRQAPYRIIVKLRAPMAQLVESELPLDSLQISTVGALNQDVATFLQRSSAKSLAPLYPVLVKAKITQHVTAQELTNAVRRQFPLRASRLNGTFQPPDLSRTYLLDLDESSPSLETALALLQADPNVEYAEPDRVVQLDFTPNDHYFNTSGSWGQPFPDLWGIHAINAPAAWDTTKGSGVVVGVVDSGVDYTHPDLAANMWTNTDGSHGWNGYLNNNNPLDDYGHGTMVAGVIGAVGNNGIGVVGVAWQARVMALKGSDNNGQLIDSDLASVIVYAADHGADVINNSWGGWGSSQTISDAISHAYNLGAVVVAAAGNGSDDARNYYPANLPQVITVAATTPTGQFSAYSNFGPKIDVAAPGDDILSLEANGVSFGGPVAPGYALASGTSLAAPHVSGAAALILAQHPTYSNEQVRQVLRASASDLDGNGYDMKLGYGQVNASSAVGIVNPLEVKIQSIQYGSTPMDPITISGIARGAGFARYTLEYGVGTLPTSWTQFVTSTSAASGVLGQLNASAVAHGVYTIRLTAVNTSGTPFSDRTQITVNTLQISSPVPPQTATMSTSYKPGKVIPIMGTAGGNGFQSYDVQWAPGVGATSGWQSVGITLAGGGLSPVANGQLATWNTSSITQAGYYTVRLTLNSSVSNTPATTGVYLQPGLMSVTWPVFMDQGFRFNIGMAPALNGDGTWRFLLPGSAEGSITGALWTLALDGTVQKTPLAGYYGDHQLYPGTFDSTPGQSVMNAFSHQMEIFHPNLTSYSFPSVSSVDFSKHTPVVEDLYGDSQMETIAVGNDYNASKAYVYAWRPNGQLAGSKFPIQLGDSESISKWINRVRVLVGDFNGDGHKELVVQNALSDSTYTLDIFASDGTPLAWAVPVLTGEPLGMIAADLDRNGKLETILLSYDGGQMAVHVFQPDGSERAGWPVEISAPNEANPCWPAAADLDRDGRMEIVISRTTDLNVFKADGTPYSTAWPLNSPNQQYNAVVIGDVDGDGYAEIVTVGNDVSTGFAQKLTAIRRDGTIAKSWQITGMNGFDLDVYPVPAIGDFNRDGITDISVTYNGWGAAPVMPGILSILSTGAAYDASLMDWPMIWHDARGTAIAIPARPTPVAAPSPASLAFGNQVVGVTSASKPVTLSNPGTSALTITGIAMTGDFSQTNNCGSSLAARASCTINVSFKPTALGARTGTLKVTDNSGGVAGSAQTVNLSGTGAAAIVVTLGPASASKPLGGTQVFTATISGTSNTALNWYVNGVLNGNAAQGTLTGTGFTRTYTAPAANVPSPNPAVIKVASVADPTVYKTATVTVTDSIVVNMTPATASVLLGGAQVFTATITGTTNTALAWYVNGVLNGNSTQGTLTGTGLTRTYTAGTGSLPNPNPAVIRCESAADPAKYKTSTITVTDNIVVGLTPATASVLLGGAQVFTATITGTTNTALNWYVNGVLNGNAAQGTLTGTGLARTYTAPAANVPSPNPAVIRCESVTDPTKFNTASMTVTDSIAVGLTPATVTVPLDSTQVFTATITGTTNTALNWYVNGVLNGNAAQGTLTGTGLTRTYTAPPLTPPSPNPATIRCESVADPAKFKTSSVTVSAAITVTLTPASASIPLGGTQVFTATITGTANKALNWYVNGVLNGNSTQGTITACTTAAPFTCKYTAPPVNVPGPNPAVIKVASAADTTKFQTANVTVTDTIVVTIRPTTSTRAKGATQLFTATITGTSNSALTWYVNGVLNGSTTQGTLTGTGLTRVYTAPTSTYPSPNPAVIKVASAADPAKYATATVTVSP